MTLESLADFEIQNRYKDRLPFVHVPNELMEQCSSVMHQTSLQWFVFLFSPAELVEIVTFLKAIKWDYHQLWVRSKNNGLADTPDCPEIFSCVGWKKIHEESRNFLEKFSGKITKKISEIELKISTGNV